MKRLLAYVLTLALAFAAPLAESATKRHGKAGNKSHAAKIVHKTKAKKKSKVAVKVKKRLTAKQHEQAIARSALSSMAMERDTGLRMSASIAGSSEVYGGAGAGIGELELRSAAALVIDQKTGEFLYAKNPDVTTPIASITTLMTAMVVIDAELPLAEQIAVDMDDVDRLKYTSSRLPVGAELSRKELLHLALIASENRAAAALSRAYPGGREAFVRAMNEKAIALGMVNTWFVDGTGLSSSNRSTAADLARLVDAASNYPLIRRITATGDYAISLPGRKIVRVREKGRVRQVTREVMRPLAFHNTNALTRSKDWHIGVSKTGFINEAGHCLVMQTYIGDRKVIMVLLDSWGKLSRIGDAARIRKWLEQGISGRLASNPGNDAV